MVLLESGILNQDIDAVKAAVAEGAGPNTRVPRSRLLPLHLAAATGNASIVKVLLAAGADPNLPDPEASDTTPLWYSFNSSPMGQVAKALLDGGADPNLRGGTLHPTPLGSAALAGATGACKVLAQAGANVNSHEPPPGIAGLKPPKDLKGWWSPLMLASYSCNSGCTAFLLLAGADTTRKTKDGKTARDLACSESRKDLQASFDREP